MINGNDYGINFSAYPIRTHLSMYTPFFNQSSICGIGQSVHDLRVSIAEAELDRTSVSETCLNRSDMLDMYSCLYTA